MAIPITIPRLGWNMEEGVFLGWLKHDGDTVRAGEMLFRLESEKAAEEIECLDSGILRITATELKEGDKIAVGTHIGQLLEASELERDFSDVTQLPPGETKGAAVPSTAVPIPIALKQRPTAIASPRARRVAAELGIDWTHLRGSGRDGRIRERDVRDANPIIADSKKHHLPLSAVRRAGVARLRQSVQATIPVTLHTTADVTHLVQLRQQFKVAAHSDEAPPSLTDFFVKLTALALQKHPLLSARWGEDHLILADELNLGIAVDTDAGLLVPVLHRVDTMSLAEITARARELIERARHSKLTTKELQGGVFTITNLGMFGIDAFTPIINSPEAAILGIGRVRRLPMYVAEKVETREQITVSLTFDHRVVDGAPAARFLQTLTQALENPGPWLIR